MDDIRPCPVVHVAGASTVTPDALAQSHRHRLKRSRAAVTTVAAIASACVVQSLTSDSQAFSGGGRHPFWVFDWGLLQTYEALTCSITLFLAGVLCSAGGIGGGGIYVTLLMVFGGLSPKDAVPLSKGVVFFGSMSSLVLNMRRTVESGSSGKKQTLINYGICRVVVPSALVGTLFGVLINHGASDAIIIMMLSAILVGMSFMTVRTTWRQYCEEQAPARTAVSAFVGAVGGNGGVPAGGPLRRRDTVGGACMLVAVVACGTLRFHAGKCSKALQLSEEGDVPQACQHPSLFFLGNGLAYVMSSDLLATMVMSLSLLLPIGLCSSVFIVNSADCIKEGWTAPDVFKYGTMASFTGCFAGLVGIGGGLIFCPFFLIMGVDPSVAVATSSTCVIFTSSSTTLQYLLCDRIIMALTVLYGFINLFASYCGTSAVHILQDTFKRRSVISGIVGVGVLISTGLALAKLFGVKGI